MHNFSNFEIEYKESKLNKDQIRLLVENSIVKRLYSNVYVK